MEPEVDGSNQESSKVKGGKGRGGKNQGGKRDRKADPAQAEGDGDQKAEGNRKGRDRDKGGGKRNRDRENEDGEREDENGQSQKGRKGKDRRGRDRDGKGGKRNHDSNEAGDGEDKKREDSERNRQGGKERGGNNNRGGKGHGGKQTRDAPMLLGSPVSPALPGLPAALGAPKYCTLCRTDGPSYVSLGPCGHAHTCWVCTLRLRALGEDKCCPVCREPADMVLITNDARTPFPTEWDNLASDSKLGVMFANRTIQRDVMRLFEYRCRFQHCEKKDVAFHSLKELQDHVWYEHWRQFCPTCLHGRTSYICEQVLYTGKSFQHHCRWGDKAQTIDGRDMPATAPHAWCDFCKEWHFDEDMLSYHMHSKHHICAICERQGKRNQFYKNLNYLSRHYAEDHWVCPHRDCCHSGHRLSVFETEMDLEMHRRTVHGDGAQMSDKDKKQLTGQLVGFRSYADEQRNNRSAGQGASRGNQTVDDFTIHFCWPKDNSFATAMEEDDENEGDTGQIDRYPDRDVLSDHGNETCPAPEVIHEEDAGGDSEDDDEDEEDDDDEDDDPNVLSKKLRSISLQETVASVGRQEGMRCCLNAMQAVLRALFPGAPALRPEILDALQSAVRSLNGDELETFGRMQINLARIGGDSLDWEPLERVLALRPLFFRLLRSAKGTGIGPSIGPKSGGQSHVSQDTSEEQWYIWRLAAQQIVRSFGCEEQQYLRAYIHFCMEHRKALHSSTFVPPVADIPKAKPTKQQPTVEAAPMATSEEFPSLGGTSSLALAEPTWGGRQKKQVVPKMAPVTAREPDVADAWEDSPAGNPVDEFPALQADEQFPSLGNKSGRQAANPGWGAEMKQPRGNSTVTAPPKAVAKPKSSAPTAMDFPSLGNASSSTASKAEEWAKAKERSAAVAKAKVEMAKPKPQPKKEFTGIEEAAFPGLAPAFPGLPTSGGKLKPATAKAAQSKGKAAASKAKAKAKGGATHDFGDLPEVIPESVQSEPEVEIVPDSQLVLIHNPLDAVARTEAAEAERRARKVKTKTGKRGAVVMNPWTAGSPTSRTG